MKKTPNYNYNLPDREDRVKIGDLNQNTDNIDIDLAKLDATVKTKAPIHSPTFSGEPLAPTPESDDSDETVYERIATVGSLAKALEVEKL